MKKILALAVFVFTGLLLFGCIIWETTETGIIANETEHIETEIQLTAEELATQECIALCESIKSSATLDLSNGPCLSNEIIEDWVCNVAHSPRHDVDNLPENQCEAFRNGTAHHFVEVDINCVFIKAY